jgi:hypothetical protein
MSPDDGNPRRCQLTALVICGRRAEGTGRTAGTGIAAGTDPPAAVRPRQTAFRLSIYARIRSWLKQSRNSAMPARMMWQGSCGASDHDRLHRRQDRTGRPRQRVWETWADSPNSTDDSRGSRSRFHGETRNYRPVAMSDTWPETATLGESNEEFSIAAE